MRIYRKIRQPKVIGVVVDPLPWVFLNSLLGDLSKNPRRDFTLTSIPTSFGKRSFTFRDAFQGFLLHDDLPFASMLDHDWIHEVFRKHKSLFGGIYHTTIVLWAFLSHAVAVSLSCAKKWVVSLEFPPPFASFFITSLLFSGITTRLCVQNGGGLSVAFISYPPFAESIVPLPNFAHLQAQPDLILGWLATNLLIGGYIANVPNPPGTSGVTITPAPPHPVTGLTVARNAAGDPVDVYALRNTVAAAPANTVPAYICNYAVNDVRSVLLGTLGDFCFTTTLNGCTFGIGPAQANHTRLVSHANHGGVNHLQLQQIRVAQGVGADLAGVTVLAPQLYRHFAVDLNMQATVFGIRTGYGWRFYFQSYSFHGQGSYRMYGVFPIM